MPSTIQDDISKAEALIEEGDYKAANSLAERIAARAGLSENELLMCMRLNATLKVKHGELDDALALVEDVLPRAHKCSDLFLAVDVYCTKAEISWRSGKLDLGLKAIEDGEELLEGMRGDEEERSREEIRRRRGKFLHHSGIIHWYKGQLNKSLEYHQMSLDIWEELNDLPSIASSLNNLGLVHWSKGDFENAVHNHHRSLAIREKLGNKQDIAVSLNNLGNVFAMKGDIDQALEVYQRSLVISKELELKQDIALNLVNIGTIFRLKGDFDKAVEYYQNSLVISEELDTKQLIALAINNLGDIHGLKGDLAEAMDHFQKSLRLYQELGGKQDIALSLTNIGEIYRKLGNFKEAAECLKQSLAIYEELDNDSYIAVVLFQLLEVALEQGDSSLAQQHLQSFKQLNQRTDNRVLDQRYRVAKALLMKSGTRIREKLDAGMILEEVIEEEVADHSLTVTAMVHLCDLLLAELKVTGEEEILLKISDLTNQLLRIAEDQASHSLLAETYLLKSKLALVELDMGQANSHLTRAYTIAEEKGLYSLAQAVANERELLLSQLTKWEMIIQQKPSTQEMVNLTHIDELIERMIRKTVASMIEEKGIAGAEAPLKKYVLVHLDLISDAKSIEKPHFRVGAAQIGISESGDILHEKFEERETGIFGLREEVVGSVRSEIKRMVETAADKDIEILIFPELTIDLNYPEIHNDILSLSQTYNMILVPGSFHDPESKQNLCRVISPKGVLWEQAKHIPARINFKGERLTEGIRVDAYPRETTICTTTYGRIAIVICRDFLDMDLRVELKNAEPAVDLIINPAFTPVTADFQAAHFDARRSIYAYCFFVNVAEFGNSLIYTPEKERTERTIKSGEVNLIYKDIDIFGLRAERRRWEAEQAKSRPYIQSTR